MNLFPFIISGLGIGAVYALAAVGLVLLYRTTGVLNFALGAVGAVGAFVAFEINRLGGGLILGCFSGIAVSAFLSSGYGRLIAPTLAYRDIVTRSIGTLGFALILLGVMGLIWGEVPRRLQFPTDKMYIVMFGVRLTYTRIIALLIAAGTVLTLSLIISRTRIGLNMRALANDRDLSLILGIPVLKVEFFSWLIIGVFSGVAGLLMANLVGLKGYALTFLVVPAIAAAIVGGMQSLVKTALAGLSIGVIEATLSAFPSIAPFRSASPYLVALLAIGVIAVIPSLPSNTSKTGTRE